MILVTGATGFIGRHLIDRLGMDKCIAIDNFSNSEPDKLGYVKYYDISLSGFVREFKDLPINLILHFGAPCSVIQYNWKPVATFRNTLDGFWNIMKLAEETGAKLVYPSSGSVYGLAYPNSEKEIPEPSNLYGIGKLQTERMASQSNIESVGLRIFAGYGPGEEKKGELSSAIGMFTQDILANRQPVIWGDGRQTRDFVYIDDVTDAIIQAGRKKVSPVINIGSGVATSFNSILDIINDLNHSKIQPKYVDKPETYLEKTKADITLMKKDLGIDPMPLRKGIAKYIDYLDGL